ncbi:hypothetical protein [Amycolatopsis keratiniphila]|uniref:hypothetical protein n=1 Tax=Amycolatopsis keratiniphila TaxID=129921 RepID=UPI000AC76EE0|nr:hypothetical protein [Amycolatopsis keratiniphila]
MPITEEHADALRLLSAAAERSKRKNVAFARSFVADLDPMPGATSSTPLSSLIQGGRGGKVRLRLYLLLTMMATRAPFDIKQLRTSQTLARTLELPKREGLRRITSNLNWLAANKYISIKRDPSAPVSVQLLDPIGNGKLLPDARKVKPYITIPIEFWSNGWLLDLSPRAIAVLFALADRLGGSDKPLYLLKDRRASYGFSHDTWTRGTAELEDHGLLTLKRVPQGNDFDYMRMRTAYWIEWKRLNTPSEASGGEADTNPAPMINFPNSL